MEHGLDERHPEILFRKSRSPQIRTQQADLLDALCVLREFHAALLPRRSRPRKKFPPPQNARRLVAAICKSPPPVGLSVRPPGEETPLHGAGTGAAQRVVRSEQSGLAPAPIRFAQGRPKTCT